MRSPAPPLTPGDIASSLNPFSTQLTSSLHSLRDVSPAPGYNGISE